MEAEDQELRLPASSRAKAQPDFIQNWASCPRNQRGTWERFGKSLSSSLFTTSYKYQRGLHPSVSVCKEGSEQGPDSALWGQEEWAGTDAQEVTPEHENSSVCGTAQGGQISPSPE